MMRTMEIFLVIIILTGAYIIASFYAFLPQPREVSPLNLRRLALTTLQTLDVDCKLGEIVFKPNEDPAWSELQIALSACLPPSIVYNLTAYEVLRETELYVPMYSISNAESLGVGSDATAYLVASSNVTFKMTPQKIGEQGGSGTLYLLNCSDASGWWTTGYTAQSLAADLYNLLAPYFKTTTVVQNTTQFSQLLDGIPLQDEPLHHAVVINTFGEAVPIPSSYADTYDDAEYCHALGNKVREYDWTWVSIVGYPQYYVSNREYFPENHNTYGIFGMKRVGAAGFNAFLQGLNDEPYVYDDTWLTGDPEADPGLANVHLSAEALYHCNYYGIYPSAYQTATRALPVSMMSRYNLTATSYVLEQVGSWIPGAFFRHGVSGALLALGLTRTPDIRLTALGLLCEFKPRLFRSEYTAADTSRLIILQLGQVGGI
jgi:hypothetical protein